MQQSTFESKSSKYLELRQQLFRFSDPSFFEILELNLNPNLITNAHFKKIKTEELKTRVSTAASPVTIICFIFQKITTFSVKLELTLLKDPSNLVCYEIRLVPVLNKKFIMSENNLLYEIDFLLKVKIRTVNKTLAKEIFGWRIVELYFYGVFESVLKHYKIENLRKYDNHVKTFQLITNKPEDKHADLVIEEENILNSSLMSVITNDNKLSGN